MKQTYNESRYEHETAIVLVKETTHGEGKFSKKSTVLSLFKREPLGTSKSAWYGTPEEAKHLIQALLSLEGASALDVRDSMESLGAVLDTPPTLNGAEPETGTRTRMPRVSKTIEGPPKESAEVVVMQASLNDYRLMVDLANNVLAREKDQEYATVEGRLARVVNRIAGSRSVDPLGDIGLSVPDAPQEDAP